MVVISVVIDGEGTSFAIVVAEVISASITVRFWCEVGVIWVYESVQWGFLGFFWISKLEVVFLKDLLVHFWIIVVWFFDHCWEGLEVWSGVKFVIENRLIGHLTSNEETSEAECTDGVSSEESISGSISMYVGPVIDPSLIWHNWNTSLETLSSSTYHKCEWVSCSSTNEEPGEEIRSVL
jgi:hypothetical protein